MKKIALIDGDIICYSVGFAAQADPLSHALHSAKVMIESMVKDTGSDDYVVFLTGDNNFRKTTATIQGYKANRTSPKPPHLEDIQNYLITHHSAVVREDDEADDGMGIFQCQIADLHDTTSVICTLDKDLRMIPGEHYNWRKKELDFVTEEEALRFFYTQLLTGDSTDNIPGLYKLTGTKATAPLKKGLDTLSTEEEMYNYVRAIYDSAYVKNGMCLDDMDAILDCWLTEIGQLLWIKREEDKLWQLPVTATHS